MDKRIRQELPCVKYTIQPFCFEESFSRERWPDLANSLAPRLAKEGTHFANRQDVRGLLLVGRRFHRQRSSIRVRNLADKNAYVSSILRGVERNRNSIAGLEGIPCPSLANQAS